MQVNIQVLEIIINTVSTVAYKYWLYDNNKILQMLRLIKPAMKEAAFSQWEVLSHCFSITVDKQKAYLSTPQKILDPRD